MNIEPALVTHLWRVRPYLAIGQLGVKSPQAKDALTLKKRTKPQRGSTYSPHRGSIVHSVEPEIREGSPQPFERSPPTGLEGGE